MECGSAYVQYGVHPGGNRTRVSSSQLCSSQVPLGMRSSGLHIPRMDVKTTVIVLRIETLRFSSITG